MAILKPDATEILNGVPVNSYLLTQHNPNNIPMPTGTMAGKVVGVTIHNTPWIKTAKGTTPAEQYTRATVNDNMKDTRVHFYTDHTCGWQNLPLTLPGWHAADGSGNGNRKTIAIECIMSPAYNDNDKKSEDNAARLAAYLLVMYNLDINHLYTHTHWLNVRDGKKGTVDNLNTTYNAYKNCPAYILPHWPAFKAKVEGYIAVLTKPKVEVAPTPAVPPAKAEAEPKTANELYRIRKSWADAKSQKGAFVSLENAKKACPAEYNVYNTKGVAVYSPAKGLTQGAKVRLENASFYASSVAASPSKKNVTGTYYIWSELVLNGRIRITNKKANVGKSMQVTAWVKTSDLTIV